MTKKQKVTKDLSARESDFVDLFIETGLARLSALDVGFAQSTAEKAESWVHSELCPKNKLHILFEIHKRKAKASGSNVLKGSKFWMARSSHGRKPIFAKPEDLWKAACEWFQWIEDNPLWEAKVTQFQGSPVKMEVPKMRAMTEGALCIFLDINQETFSEYGKKDDFSGVVMGIRSIIRAQKFTGAAADMLNPNIIARDLGLKDHQDLSSQDGSMTPKSPEISDDQLASELAKYGIERKDS